MIYTKIKWSFVYVDVDVYVYVYFFPRLLTTKHLSLYIPHLSSTTQTELG